MDHFIHNIYIKNFKSLADCEINDYKPLTCL